LLSDIKEKYKLPITTDVHESSQVEIVSSAVDIIQIPAFLCRQTDLLLEAGKTNKIVNIKKAQFLSGADMKYPTEKILSTGNNQIMLTERGTMFGYNNLVVDFRNIPDMQKLQFPVIMDCTHSVQRPGGMGEKTGGNREFVPSMALAAKAFGVNGYFFEIHPNPEKALCDGPNSLPLNQIDSVIKSLL
jgi:2-dehydro-3-deoxyphosphooctonate aldolase (KDO 8-P synthase)